MLDTAQLKGIEDRLRARAAQLTVEVDAVRRRAGIGLGREVSDAKEVASVGTQIVIDDAEVDRDLAELREIQAARQRIQKGTYGSCVDCGADIEPDRIQAQPQASRCLQCQLRTERVPVAGASRRAMRDR